MGISANIGSVVSSPYLGGRVFSETPYSDTGGIIQAIDVPDLIKQATKGSLTYKVWDSALALIVIDWMGRSVAQTEIRAPAHDGLQNILRFPHPEYTSRNWIKKIGKHVLIHGQSYVRIIEENRRPVRLTPIDPKAMAEVPDDSINNSNDFRYYRKNGDLQSVPIEQMLVFKWDISDDSLYRGTGPFTHLVNEMFMDARAAEYTGYVLKNAMTGWLVGLDQSNDKNIAGAVFSKQEQKDATDKLNKLLVDESAGLMQVLPFALSLVRLEPTFTDLDFIRFHNLAEERVCSAVSIHPSVLGLGTGVQNTRVGATAYEYRRESWRSGVIPLLQIIEDELTLRLLPKFVDDFESAAPIYLFRGHINEMRPSPLEMQMLLKAHEQGIFNSNEIREEYGKDGRPDGDEYVAYPPPRPNNQREESLWEMLHAGLYNISGGSETNGHHDGVQIPS